VPFDPNFIARLIPALLEGAEVTVELALLTIGICLVWGLAVAVGLGGLLAVSRLAYDVLRVAGALYLIYLGVRLLIRPAPRLDGGSAGEGCSENKKQQIQTGGQVGFSHTGWVLGCGTVTQPVRVSMIRGQTQIF